MTIPWLSAMLCALTGYASAAQPTHFGFKQIVINGSSEVFATAINDRSMIAGTYVAAGQAYGFTSSGTSFNNIPFVCFPFGTIQCVPVPSAINRLGLVAGVAFTPQNFDEEATYFTWQAGEAAPAFLTNSAALGQIFLNDKNDVALPCYEYVYLHQLTQCGVFEGPISHIDLVNGLSDDATLQSLNRAGAIAGVQPLTFHGKQILAGFTVHGGKIHNIIPPNVEYVNSLVINDKFQLAGSYVDTAGLWHGFTQHDGQITLFDMPTSAGHIAVTNENNSGRVVGYYSDAKGSVHPFIYNGMVTTKITNRLFIYAPSVQINDEGTIILADAMSGMPPFGSQSWRVLCGGPGC